MTIWFDVEDLFHFVRSGNKRTTGIQRLTLEIYRAAEALSGGDGAVRFVRHGRSGEIFEPVTWPDILAQFAPQETPPAEAPAIARPAVRAPIGPSRSLTRRAMRSVVNRLPEDVRQPMVLASVMQLQAASELLRFGANTIANPARQLVRRVGTRPVRGRTGTETSPKRTDAFEREVRPGDTLLVLGSPWFRSDYSAVARWLRDKRRMRFGVLVHDLVPIRRPEWSDIGTTLVFESWYADLLPFCDLVLSNSRHTADDVEAYAREEGIVLSRPVQPLPIGAGFGLARQEDGPAPPDLQPPGSYALFVSTMEARKNHTLAVRVWKRLLDEVASGRRDPASVPDLVFAGRVGWLVADLVQQLDNTGWLGGRVRMIQDPTDDDLRALYRGCLFTLFPSFYEGWGLPVSESLSFGKPCLCSNATALPEAGGALCRYFDPESLESAYRAVAAVLDDPAGLAAWEAEVRRDYRPIPWSETARTLFEAVAALDRPQS